jgi:peroxiredoxin
MSTKAIPRKQTTQKKRKRNFLIFASVIVLAIGGWVIWNTLQPSQSQTAATSGSVGISVGDTAPNFSVPTLDGETFTLTDGRGNPAIVFFMAYWCGTCLPEAQALAQLKGEYGDKLNIVAIDLDPSSTPQALEQFKQAAGGESLTWAFDTDQQVASSFQVRSLDTTLVLNAGGVIVYRDEFPSPYKTLKDALSQAGF